MFRVRDLAVLFVLAVAASSAEGGPPAPGVYTEEPPKEVKELIDLLKQGEVRVIKPLSERDEAAPYLRLELKAVSGGINLRRERHLREALAPIEARIYQRNKKQFEEWVEKGRFDLCTELLVTCPEKDAPELADLTFPLRQKVAKSFLKVIDPFGPAYTGEREMFWWPVFKARGKFEYFAGADLTLPPTTGLYASGTLVRADHCTTEVFYRGSWFVAVRSELREELEKRFRDSKSSGKWSVSIVLVNNSTKLTQGWQSLIVCDGDVELTSEIYGCVVIANGNISKKGTLSNSNYFAATGDISVPLTKEKGKWKCVFHAGGTVTPAERPGTGDIVRQKQKSLPFGVKFLDPGEFGLDLEAQKDGVKLTGVEKDSPFARYGVEAGDVVASIDGTKVASLPDFRRQLRRALLAESVTLRIRRGDQALTRIVFLDGIPLPAAPAPRDAKRPSP